MSITDRNIERSIWEEPAADAGEQAMRDALIECAKQICHETGTEEGTVDFWVDTVRDFLRVEEVRRLKRELKNAYENNHRRNLELDALHYVWCDGGCRENTEYR